MLTLRVRYAFTSRVSLVLFLPLLQIFVYLNGVSLLPIVWSCLHSVRARKETVGGGSIVRSDKKKELKKKSDVIYSIVVFTYQ